MKRRHFFKIIGSIFGLATIAVTDISIQLSEKVHKQKYKPIKVSEIKNTINFYDDLIITSVNNKINVFSSKCTHLGCKINSYKDEDIICPCHGSRFYTDGKVIKGPADKNLKKMEFEIFNDEIHIRS